MSRELFLPAHPRFFEQKFFRQQTLPSDQIGKFQRHGTLAENPPVQLLQCGETFGDWQNFRVRNRVRRAREQICEADLRANRAQQPAQHQIKRARRRLEQII